jgi:hypothetical protein
LAAKNELGGRLQDENCLDFAAVCDYNWLIVKNDKGTQMQLSQKATRLLRDGVLVMGVLMVIGILGAMAAANKVAADGAGRAKSLIETTRKTCVKYADAETVTGAWTVRKVELFRCPDGRVVVLQK